MNKTIGFGIVGTGMIANYHAKAIKALSEQYNVRVAGALDSRDKESTSSRAPWAPMQPYLLGLAEDGRGLYNQLKAQPFSPAQQTAYNNQFGLLNAINQNAGGLLGGFNANASGANQFVRGQPQRLQGSTFNLGGYTPGLLTGFTRG